MLTRLLESCARRRGAAVAATAAYVVAVSLTHDQVQDLAYWLQRTSGPRVWAPIVGVLALAGAVWGALAARNALARSPVRRAAATAWWTTLVLLAAAFFTLLATNMEAVHFVQYALPAIPVYALTRRFSLTALIVTALGALDETWQYAVLHLHWGVQWDANDLVLNGLGAALGCAAIAVFADVESAEPPPARPYLAVVEAAVAVFGGGLALRAAGLLSLYPEDGPAWLLLSRSERPESRWEVPEWGRGHHIVHPAVGFGIVLALALGCAWLDARVRWRPRAERDR